MKICPKCGEVKSLSAFSRKQSRPDGLQCHCKACVSEGYKRWRAKQPAGLLPYQRRWYERGNNAERNAARTSAWKQANRDRVNELERRRYSRNLEEERQRAREYQHRRRALRGPVSSETMQRTQEVLAEPCVYCGSIDLIEIDHIVPLSRGGNHTPENLAPACRPCNRSKGAKLLSEWPGAD